MSPPAGRPWPARLVRRLRPPVLTTRRDAMCRFPFRRRRKPGSGSLTELIRRRGPEDVVAEVAIGDEPEPVAHPERAPDDRHRRGPEVRPDIDHVVGLEED